MAPSSFPSMTKSSTESSLTYRPLVPLISSCMFRRYWSRSICARKPWGWRYKMVSSIFCVDKYVHVDTCLINPPPLQKSTVKQHFLHDFYLCELCEAISGRINLYLITLVSHNNYTSLTTHTSSHNATCTFKCTFLLDQCSSTLQIVELVTALLRHFQATASTHSYSVDLSTNWSPDNAYRGCYVFLTYTTKSLPNLHQL